MRHLGNKPCWRIKVQKTERVLEKHVCKMDPMFFLVHRLMQQECACTKEVKKVVKKPSDQEILKRKYKDIEFWLTVGIYV
jgi:hypothetical protein